MVGGEELVAAIAAGGAGAIAFDKCLATVDMASKLGRVARVGGLPRALAERPEGPSVSFMAHTDSHGSPSQLTTSTFHAM